jgi:probable rRNA maturation factor
MDLTLHFNRVADWPAVAGTGDRLYRAARSALLSAGPAEGEVSFTFVSREEIRALNRRWLGRDVPTDVIAFELGEGDTLIGDVYISPEVAATNAAERGEAEALEILRLVIHGALHVIGLDHPDVADRESSVMFQKQEELLEALGED